MSRRHHELQQPHTLDLYRGLIVDGARSDHVDDMATHVARGVLVHLRPEMTPVLTGGLIDRVRAR